jgi:predicted nucleotidyltransferase
VSLATALYTDSQARVYRWLFGQPERGYHLSELRRLTGLGSASLQRELKRLTEAGLVRSERVGNLRRFQANPQSPVYAELVALTRKSLGVEAMLREALRPLAPRLRAAWVYGSVAKQTDKAESDIDVMVVGEDLPLADVLEVVLPLEEKLGRKINPTCYTPEEFERRRNEPDSFVNRVLAQPTLPLVGEVLEPAGAG